MRLGFAIALLPLLAACDIQPADPPEYRPEQAGTVDHALCLLGFAAVPLRTLASGHHLVDVTLNGQPGTFVLDTGANATVLDAFNAGSFGLAEGAGRPAGAVGLGGGMRATQASIDSFHIGPVPIRQSRIMITDLGRLADLLGPMAGETIHGIVGQDVLAEHRAVIDVARPILHLIEADEEPAPVPAGFCRTEADGPEDTS